MFSPFWTHTIWYILLAATSVTLLMIALKKAPDRRFAFAFLFGVLGFTYVLEAILVIVFNAYHYHPAIVSDSFQDSVLGNIFSQVSVSTSALLIAVFGLSWKWRTAFSVVYFLIDVLFSTLGVYEHEWYRSIYSLFGFFIYSWAVQQWYCRLRNNPPRFLFYLTWFLGIFALTGNTIVLPLKLLKLQIFSVGIFSDISKDHTTGMIIYAPILIVLIIAHQYWIAPRTLKWIPFLLLTFLQYVLYSAGFILIKPGWLFIVTAADLLGIYVWCAWLNRSLKTIYAY